MGFFKGFKNSIILEGRKIMDYIKWVVRTGIAILARCFPIKKNIIVFASYPDFSDNAWVIYKYLKKNRTDLNLYWAMSGNDVSDDVDEREILKVISLKSYIHYLWIINRARFLMSTHGLRGIGLSRNRQINVYLNHGGCAIKGAKTIGIDHPSRDFKVKPKFDYILCRGFGSIIPVSIFNCCEPNIVLPLGLARDDIFRQNIGASAMNPFYNGTSKKLIIWMPTFRKSLISPHLSEQRSSTSTGLPLIENECDLIELNTFLKEMNIQLLIKIHPLQEDNELFAKKLSNISIVSNKDLNRIKKQTYEVIGYSDALLTDYSSVYFDYLITNKPIGFILDDYDKYDKDRGFVFDNPKAIMAGHHIYNLKELHQFLIDILNDNDLYEDLRKNMKERFVGVLPESTSQTIIDYFKI